VLEKFVFEFATTACNVQQWHLSEDGCKKQCKFATNPHHVESLQSIG